jgi:hypothetical protein
MISNSFAKATTDNIVTTFWITTALTVTPTASTDTYVRSFEDFTTYMSGMGEDRLFTFADWRLLKIVAHFVPAQDLEGTAFLSFQESQLVTASDSRNANARAVTCTNRDSSRRVVTWNAASFEDLSFKPVRLSLDPIPVYLYCHMLNLNNWSSGEAFVVNIRVKVQARGLSDQNSISSLRKVFPSMKEYKRALLQHRSVTCENKTESGSGSSCSCKRCSDKSPH